MSLQEVAIMLMAVLFGCSVIVTIRRYRKERDLKSNQPAKAKEKPATDEGKPEVVSAVRRPKPRGYNADGTPIYDLPKPETRKEEELESSNDLDTAGEKDSEDGKKEEAKQPIPDTLPAFSDRVREARNAFEVGRHQVVDTVPAVNPRQEQGRTLQSATSRRLHPAPRPAPVEREVIALAPDPEASETLKGFHKKPPPKKPAPVRIVYNNASGKWNILDGLWWSEEFEAGPNPDERKKNQDKAERIVRQADFDQRAFQDPDRFAEAMRLIQEEDWIPRRSKWPV